MQCFGASNGSLHGTKQRPTSDDGYSRPICATLQSESRPQLPKREGRRLGVARGHPAGPWDYVYPRIKKPGYSSSRDGNIECGINPSLFQLSNGTWLLATRYDNPLPNRSKLTLATAATYEGPFTVVSWGEQWQEGVATGGSEDPFVWRNGRGYHMIHHNGPHGRHVWSHNGLDWEGYLEPSDAAETATDAYNMSISYQDGMYQLVRRRERPWLMLDQNGNPLHLVTGCEACQPDHTACRSFTVLTPLLPLDRTPAAEHKGSP